MGDQSKKAKDVKEIVAKPQKQRTHCSETGMRIYGGINIEATGRTKTSN